MAEPLKDMYTKTFLQNFGKLIRTAYPPFDTAGFIAGVMDETWDSLELKARIRRIAVQLGSFLPAAYEEALPILFQIDGQCEGFPYLFFPDFVEVSGQGDEHWPLSMQALERFTSKSSAEFAVRSFLLRDPERMMKQMLEWAGHPDEHVRRLASEGCRPRLPWGQSLPVFKRDPAPIMPILERLKADPSLYVRKSVANNLNDIAKDHPELVLETAKRWIGNDPHTDWIVRHGCRTMIRKANPEVLELFGYADDGDGQSGLAEEAEITAVPSEIAIGGQGELNYRIRIRPGAPAKVRVEYGIAFRKARGQVSTKLFLLSDKTVEGGAVLSGSRTHRWADLTTRKHYAGEHRIALLLNGKEVASSCVQLREE
ncbi:DNA alkylation repair protein [Paenibacillus protaetiae]|uniref:DNA alkylation repair protein n=1 Tax=Paenibacillus protaetiae TaxID=2509456 RepID=A0A4P6ETG3_9BACL|nr:DNA alkylation repair protein [Paenibacillus protaetiae]QAY65926.1 hypothetical protein ET464_05530 [Paenibacillus protaetiae]